MARIQQMSKQHGATTGHSVEARLRIWNMLQETRGLSPETVPNQRLSEQCEGGNLVTKC